MFVIKKKLVHIYIDESNIWSIQKSKRVLIDWKRFKGLMEEKYKENEVVFYYYCCYPKGGTRASGYGKKYRLFAFLEKSLGFRVVKKPLKQIKEFDGTIREKGNMDVEIAMDITLHACETKRLQNVVLCSGDSDFACLIPMVKSRNINFEVLSSKNSVSKELISKADKYIDLKDIKKIWGNPLKRKTQ